MCTARLYSVKSAGSGSEDQARPDSDKAVEEKNEGDEGQKDEAEKPSWVDGNNGPEEL